MENTIGVDLGATTIKSALISKGKIIKKAEVPTEADKGTDIVLRNLFSSVEKVRGGKIRGIGIGSPGPMDYKKGMITNPVNLPFRNVALKKIMEKEFSLPVMLDNDANCFALAESIFGQGKRYENVVGITLGTGFGGGLAIDKKVYHGRSNATEFGHMSIKYNGLKSKSGNSGSIEEYVSARGITKLFDRKLEPKDIQNLAVKGDKKALDAYKKMGSYLGIGLANIIYAFDPDIIIIGGKIVHSWPFFHEPMEKEVKKRYFAKPPKIIKSRLDEAGVLGAAALVLRKGD